VKTSHAIKLFGSKRDLQDALGITRQAVSNWGDTVPPLREYQIKEIVAMRARLDV
jgi:hypothetical protein